MSNLIDHAQYEMTKAGLFDEDADYGGAHAKAVMDLMQVFDSQQHSGMSAGMTIHLFTKLASFEPLTDVTSDPEEWVHVANEDDGRPIHQNKRRSTSFSNDGGKTWYDIEDRSRDNGATWHGWPAEDPNGTAPGAWGREVEGYKSHLWEKSQFYEVVAAVRHEIQDQFQDIPPGWTSEETAKAVTIVLMTSLIGPKPGEDTDAK